MSADRAGPVAAAGTATASVERLASLLPGTVRRWLVDNPDVWRRTISASVVSADITGFTRLAEHLADSDAREAAETLSDTINRCFVPMIDEVVERGGDVVKFGGDAIFAIFEGADHEQQACAAAGRMQRMIGAVDLGAGLTLSMTVGVASGPVELILAGTGRRELIVHGSVVDECLRLEAEAEPGEVLASNATVRALPLDWIDQPEPDLWALVDRTVTTHPFPATTRPVPDADLLDCDEVLGADLASAVESFAGTAGEIRVVTMAFVHLPTADLDDEVTRRVVERAIDLSARYGSTLLNIDVAEGGIKLLFTAGAPVATDDDEDAILGTLSELVLGADSPAMRAGVNRGLVHAGLIGSPRYRAFTVMGDSTNLAARLLGKADDRSVTVAQTVLDHARSRYQSTKLSPVLVKGRLAPVTPHRLGRIAPEDHERLTRPTFVGRDEPLARMHAALATATSGRGSVINVLGEAGVGVSRLLEELLAGVPSGVMRVTLTGRVADRGKPYRTARAALRAVAELDERAGPEESGIGLGAWIERLAPDERRWLPLLAPAFGAELADDPDTGDAGPHDRILAEFRQDRTTEILAELLGRALTEPTLFAVEDLHWVDPASLELITAIARASAHRPWLIVSTTRPGMAELDPGDGVATERLVIGPLDGADALAIVAETGDLPAARQEEIARRSGGNPLFAIELARTDAAEGAALDSRSLDSIEGLVTARIDRLGHEPRVLVRTAAVLGPRFEVDLLGQIVGAQVDLAGLEHLIVVEGDGWAAFRSDVVHEVAHRGLSARRRRELHDQVARLLEDRDADIAELAWHHGRAGNHAASWTYNRRSADRAHRLGLMNEATDHLVSAITAADADPEGTAAPDHLTEALIELYEVGVAAKRYDEALAAGERALGRLTDPLDRIRLLVRLTVKRSQLDGSYAAQMARLTEALAECGNGPEDAEARAWLRGALAGLHFRTDDRSTALALADTAIADATTAGAVDPKPPAMLVRHVVLIDRGHPDRLAAGDELIAATTEAGDRGLLTTAHSNVGMSLQSIGDWIGALDHYRAAIELADELGDGYRRMVPAINRAGLWLDQGLWDQARDALDEERRAAVYHGSGWAAAWAKQEQGRLEVQAGRPGVGRPLLEEALSWFTDAGVQASIYEAKLDLIAADLAEGRSAAVLEAAGALQPPDEPVPHVLGQLQTLVGYALLQQGRFEAALEQLDAAVAATEGRFLFGHALALVGRSDAEDLLGRTGSARRTSAMADAILSELGVVALPVIPLPR